MDAPKTSTNCLALPQSILSGCRMTGRLQGEKGSACPAILFDGQGEYPLALCYVYIYVFVMARMPDKNLDALVNRRADIAAIAAALPQDRSVISRHLKVMSEAGILKCEKITRHVYYEIDGTSFSGRLETIAAGTKQCMPACRA